MNRSIVARVTLGVTMGLAFVALVPGCGSPTQAEPLEVTYYYLPG